MSEQLNEQLSERENLELDKLSLALKEIWKIVFSVALVGYW